MKQRRHTPEQVIRKLRGAARLLAEGRGVGEVCRYVEVSEPMYHRWRNQYGLNAPPAGRPAPVST